VLTAGVVVGVVGLMTAAGADAEPRSPTGFSAVSPLAEAAIGEAGYRARVDFALPATMVATILVPTLNCAAGEGFIAAEAGLQGVNRGGGRANNLGFIGLSCDFAGNPTYVASGAAGSQFVASIPVAPGDKVKVVIHVTAAVGRGADVSVMVRDLATGRAISGVDSGFTPRYLIAAAVPYVLHPVAGFARIRYGDITLAGMPINQYSPERFVIHDESTRDVLVSATGLNSAGDGFSLVSRQPAST
jgi:hypothetical protein